MSNTLVTGATGLVGFHIVRALLQRRRSVRLLARSPDKARVLFGEHPAPGPDQDQDHGLGLEIVAGDVTDPESIAAAMSGCDVVYHAAGLPEQWLRDPEQFQRVNVQGTENMVQAALASGVRRFVYTSTIDVFAGARGESYDESILDPAPKGTHYERSKQDADRVVVAAHEQHGLDVVFLHPSGVYGPGPAGSPGTTQFIADLRDRKVPMLLPGGMPVVFAEDVGEGHVLAEERAQPGARYILSESYITLVELAALVHEQLDYGRVPKVMPLWLGRAASWCTEAWARVSGKPPLIPKGQLHFMQWGALPDSTRATRELEWQPTPLADGVRRTLEHLGATASELVSEPVSE